jgi:hypothetical protein
MKPITSLIMCKHCKAKFPDNDMWYYCELQNQRQATDEPCTIQDWVMCPLFGKDDKDIRTGVRT